MYYGIDLPNFGAFADPKLLVEMACEAEQAGWDGFFLWDHISLGMFPVPMADPWITLTAIATRTERLRFGPMVTPLPRRRPWKVAREAVTLDILSGGRLILGVGAGAGYAWEELGEAGDARDRAAMLDEALQVITGLWHGDAFSYSGKHYHLRDTVFQPSPVQKPRIPIWVASLWPKTAPVRRAAQWDGIVPSGGDWSKSLTPAMIEELTATLRTYRHGDETCEVVIRGLRTTGVDVEQDRALVAPYQAAGGTWWFENVLSGEEPEWDIEAARERIRRGPPRVTA